jgi:hypothetical protein
MLHPRCRTGDRRGLGTLKLWLRVQQSIIRMNRLLGSAKLAVGETKLIEEIRKLTLDGARGSITIACYFVEDSAESTPGRVGDCVVGSCTLDNRAPAGGLVSLGREGAQEAQGEVCPGRVLWSQPQQARCRGFRRGIQHIVDVLAGESERGRVCCVASRVTGVAPANVHACRVRAVCAHVRALSASCGRCGCVPFRTIHNLAHAKTKWHSLGGTHNGRARARERQRPRGRATMDLQNLISHGRGHGAGTGAPARLFAA